MPLAAVGYLDGTLAIYDLSTQSLRHKCQHEVLPCLLSLGLEGGVVSFFGPSKTSLAAQGLSWGQFPICASPSAPPASPKAAADPAQWTCSLTGSPTCGDADSTGGGGTWRELRLSGGPQCSPCALPLSQSGIVQLLWEESSAVVYTCSLDGAVRLWDAHSGKMISEYRGHSAEILDFAVNK